MDIKKVAMVIAITALLPLFVGLFTDAAYQEPSYAQFCNNSYSQVSMPQKVPIGTNCTTFYDSRQDACYRDGGSAEYNYSDAGCQQFSYCNYCNKYHDEALQKYNRNIFFVLLPVGLAIVIAGIYLAVDYLGAGLMFAGLIIMFYATMRYFSNMSKILRALVILIELLVIMWIGYKKIGANNTNHNNVNSEKINKSKNTRLKNKR